MLVRTLRDAKPDDAAMLCEAERQVARLHGGLLVSEPEELEERSFADRIRRLSSGRGKYLIAEVNGHPVGHACLWPLELKRVHHVLRLDMCVHLGHWRQGHGEALLRGLLEWARAMDAAHKVELLVRAHNEAAIALYHKLGFVIEGRHRDRIRLNHGRFADDLSMALLL